MRTIVVNIGSSSVRLTQYVVPEAGALHQIKAKSYPRDAQPENTLREWKWPHAAEKSA